MRQPTRYRHIWMRRNISGVFSIRLHRWWTSLCAFFVECYDGWCSAMCKATRFSDRTLFSDVIVQNHARAVCQWVWEGVVLNKSTFKRIVDQFHSHGTLPLPRSHPGRVLMPEKLNEIQPKINAPLRTSVQKLASRSTMPATTTFCILKKLKLRLCRTMLVMIFKALIYMTHWRNCHHDLFSNMAKIRNYFL